MVPAYPTYSLSIHKGTPEEDIVPLIAAALRHRPLIRGLESRLSDKMHAFNGYPGYRPFIDRGLGIGGEEYLGAMERILGVLDAQATDLLDFWQVGRFVFIQGQQPQIRKGWNTRGTTLYFPVDTPEGEILPLLAEALDRTRSIQFWQDRVNRRLEDDGLPAFRFRGSTTTWSRYRSHVQALRKLWEELEHPNTDVFKHVPDLSFPSGSGRVVYNRLGYDAGLSIPLDMVSNDTSITSIAASVQDHGVSVMDRVRAIDEKLRTDHGYRGSPVKISWNDAPDIELSDLDSFRSELDSLRPTTLFERADGITVAGTGNTTASSLGRWSRWSTEEKNAEEVTVYLNPASGRTILPLIRNAIDESAANYALIGQKTREIMEDYKVDGFFFDRGMG